MLSNIWAGTCSGRAAWLAFSGSRSRASFVGTQSLLRQLGCGRAGFAATANGAYARQPHHPPSVVIGWTELEDFRFRRNAVIGFAEMPFR